MNDNVPEDGLVEHIVSEEERKAQDMEVVKAFMKIPNGDVSTLTLPQRELLINLIFNKSTGPSRSDDLNSLYRDIKRLQREYPVVFGQHVHCKPRRSTRRKKRRK